MLPHTDKSGQEECSNLGETQSTYNNNNNNNNNNDNNSNNNNKQTKE